VFALYTVLFPGATLAIRVFEERYLKLMERVVPDGTLVLVAIRHGREVEGPAEPYRVGVTTSIDERAFADDGTGALRAKGRERVRLAEPRTTEPYPVWHVEPFPDEGSAGPADLEAAVEAYRRFLAATAGGDEPLERLQRDPRRRTSRWPRRSGARPPTPAAA